MDNQLKESIDYLVKIKNKEIEYDENTYMKHYMRISRKTQYNENKLLMMYDKVKIAQMKHKLEYDKYKKLKNRFQIIQSDRKKNQGSICKKCFKLDYRHGLLRTTNELCSDKCEMYFMKKFQKCPCCNDMFYYRYEVKVEDKIEDSKGKVVACQSIKVKNQDLNLVYQDEVRCQDCQDDDSRNNTFLEMIEMKKNNDGVFSVEYSADIEENKALPYFLQYKSMARFPIELESDYLKMETNKQRQKWVKTHLSDATEIYKYNPNQLKEEINI